jgi:hypothetical protein
MTIKMLEFCCHWDEKFFFFIKENILINIETNKNKFVCQYLFKLLELNIEIKQLYVCY